ncbi:MAG: RHS repeat-associated core domain-containing protein [Cyanobacteria bacterium SZAS LIN-2]|nr:RHS repeat-associated core domain-containing protein [Cyanobacteria bacterium SZAS LIN-2]
MGQGEAIYNYFRDYDPQTGRYVQSDPIGLRGGKNTYAYVGANPVSRLDRFGLMCTAGLGCWTTPAERQAAASGNYMAYYQLACAGGDAYACFAQHVAADDNNWGHAANDWLRLRIRLLGWEKGQCIDEATVLDQIRKGLANAYAEYLPSSPSDARWPTMEGVAEFHWNELAKYGLPPGAFGGTPGGSLGGFLFPMNWCPNCGPQAIPGGSRVH